MADKTKKTGEQPGKRKAYVRVLTEKRREQNRKSQKAYRDRMKRRLEDLEELETAVKSIEPQIITPAAQDWQQPVDVPQLPPLDSDAYQLPDDFWEQVAKDQLVEDGLEEIPYQPSAIIDLGDAFEESGDLMLPAESNFPFADIAIRPREPTPLSDEAKPSPNWHRYWSTGISPATSESHTPTSATSAGQTEQAEPPARHSHFSNGWIQSSSSSSHNTTTHTPSSSSRSSTGPHISTPSPSSIAASASQWPGFSISANYLRMQGINCFAASLSIASSIGITSQSYVEDHPSPFYLSARCFESGFCGSGTPAGVVPPTPLFTDFDQFSDLAVPLLSSGARNPFKQSWAMIKPDLRPTPSQLALPHPSYLDCIIFPSFRSRAISLSAEGQLDHWSLFTDLIHDGLVCWGSVRSDGMENGVAWSMRSWEARPWFLKKWWFLAGGEDDEVYNNSKWWWSMRGEDVDL